MEFISGIKMPLTNFSYSLSYQQFIVSRMQKYAEAYRQRDEYIKAISFETFCSEIIERIIANSF